ncbi:alpha/beta hydrolase [Chloroflexota bacterium]
MIKITVVQEVEGLKISGQLYLPTEGDQAARPTVCICHGIPSGRRPDPSDGGYPLLAEKICYEGFAVFIFNFRGTGASDGNLDITGWTRDLKAVIDYLGTLPQVDKSHLSLLGFSGGAIVSIYVASHDTRISSVVSCACPAEFTLLAKFENPSSLIEHFRGIGAIRDENFPHSVKGWINDFRLVSPIKYVARIAPRPLLLVHGNRDETVPVNHAYELHARAGEPKRIVIVDGAGHRLRQDDRAMATVIDWLKARCSD